MRGDIILFRKKNTINHHYRALASQDPSRREDAASSLLSLDTAELGDVLTRIDGEEAGLRSTLIQAFAAAGGAGFSSFINVIECGDPVTLNIAEQILSKIDDESALLPALSALYSTSARARKAAQDFFVRTVHDAFELLLQTLNGEDITPRRIAAEIFGSRNETRAIPHLVEALNDPSEEVQEGAAWALGEIGEPALTHLKKALNNDTMGKKALEVMIDIKSPRVFNEILAALSGKDREIRWKAAEALGELGNKKAIPSLIACLRDRDRDMRRIASSSLAELGKPAIPHLVGALFDKSSFVRNGAQRALEDIGTLSIPPIVNALKEANPDEQNVLLRLLEKLGDLYPDTLVRNLRDPEPFIRSETIRIFGKLRNEDYISHLIKMIKDPDRDVRYTAADALGNFGPAVIGPVLQFAKKNPDHSLYEASLVLNRVCTRNCEEIIEALQSPSDGIRRIAARALGTAKSVSAVPSLIAVLSDESKIVRESSAWALGEIGDPRALPHLINELCDSSQEEQSPGIMWAIIKIADDSAGSQLTNALDDTTPFVRMRAAATLGLLRYPGAVDKLIALLSDGSSNVRRASAEALGNIGDMKAEAPLISAMEQTSGEEWNALRSALITLRKMKQEQSCTIPRRNT